MPLRREREVWPSRRILSKSADRSDLIIGVLILEKNERVSPDRPELQSRGKAVNKAMNDGRVSHARKKEAECGYRK